MNKKLLVGATALIVSTSTFAGGLLTNTNQNAAYLRNPARDAAIAIDGVYSNPAGIAFLPEGFHFSLTWQAAWQKREITSTAPFYALNTATPGVMTKKFEGTAKAPVIPSFQAAYVFNDKWSVSAQFAIGGGGGKCEFDNGLPMFEQLIGGQLATAGATSYSLKQNLTGEQYFYALQIGGTYKITDKVSVFGGVRGVLADCGYSASISDVMANGVPASAYLNGVSEFAAGEAASYAEKAQAAAAAGMAEQAAMAAAAAEQYGAAAKTAGTYAALLKDNITLDCMQSGFGITPIIGVDVNLGKLNLAAKYEFRTKINLENDSKNSFAVDALMPQYADGVKNRSDIPALLTVGAQYSILPSLRVSAGYHQYFDKDAKGSATEVSDNTWEALLGVEYDINDKWLVSAGALRTQYGFDDEDMNNTTFNISNTSVAFGAAYQINDMLKVNVGYYHTFYEDHEVPGAKEGMVDVYTRKNDVVGVSLDFRF